MRYILNNINNNILWPAVAGNIMWVLSTKILRENSFDWPSIIFLIALMFYAALGYLRHTLPIVDDNGVVRTKKLECWEPIFTLVHIILLIFISISSEYNEGVLQCILTLFFLFAIIDHIVSRNNKLIIPSGVGLVVLWVSSIGFHPGIEFCPRWEVWKHAISVWIALFVWLLFRFSAISELKKKAEALYIA